MSRNQNPINIYRLKIHTNNKNDDKHSKFAVRRTFILRGMIQSTDAMGMIYSGQNVLDHCQQKTAHFQHLWDIIVYVLHKNKKNRHIEFSLKHIDARGG